MTQKKSALIVVLVLTACGVASCQEPAPAETSTKYEEIFFEWVSTAKCSRARRNIEAVVVDLDNSSPSDEVNGVLKVLDRDGRPPEGLVIPRLNLIVDDKLVHGALAEVYDRLWRVAFRVNPAKRAEIEKALNARIIAKGKEIEPEAYQILAMVGKEDTLKNITQFLMTELQDKNSKFWLMAIQMLGHLGVQEARPELEKIVAVENKRSLARNFALTSLWRLKLLSTEQWQDRLVSAARGECSGLLGKIELWQWAIQTLLRRGCKSESFLQLMRKRFDAQKAGLEKDNKKVTQSTTAMEFLVVLKELEGTLSADEEEYLKEIGYSE